MKRKNKAADKKRNLRLALVGIIIAFAAAIAFSIYSRPDAPKTDQLEPITEISSSTARELLDDDFLLISPRKRTRQENARRRKVLRDLAKQMENMSLATKRNLARKIIKHQLVKLREKTAGMTTEQKRRYINAIRETIRNDFKTMSAKDTADIRSKMSSEKGRKEVSDALDAYYNEISANDRKLYDPLVMDMIGGLNSVINSK